MEMEYHFVQWPMYHRKHESFYPHLSTPNYKWGEHYIFRIY